MNRSDIWHSWQRGANGQSRARGGTAQPEGHSQEAGQEWDWAFSWGRERLAPRGSRGPSAPTALRHRRLAQGQRQTCPLPHVLPVPCYSTARQPDCTQGPTAVWPVGGGGRQGDRDTWCPRYSSCSGAGRSHQRKPPLGFAPCAPLGPLTAVRWPRTAPLRGRIRGESVPRPRGPWFCSVVMVQGRVCLRHAGVSKNRGGP